MSSCEKSVDHSSQRSNDGQKLTRAAKRREKRAALQRSQEAAALKTRSDDAGSTRNIENSNLTKQLSSRNLKLHTVPSDGDCLYQSIAHQLIFRRIPLDHLVDPVSSNLDECELQRHYVTILRRLASHHVRSNPEDFMPFLFNPENGEPLKTAEYEEYCDNIEKPSTWGGQIEIRALSNVLKIPIEIIQADSAPIVVGEEFGCPSLTIVYHRHAFALGEHYNSCIPIDAP